MFDKINNPLVTGLCLFGVLFLCVEYTISSQTNELLDACEAKCIEFGYSFVTLEDFTKRKGTCVCATGVHILKYRMYLTEDGSTGYLMDHVLRTLEPTAPESLYNP